MKLLARYGLILMFIASPCLSLGQGRERIIVRQWQSPTPPTCPIIKNTDGKTIHTNLIALEVVNIFVAKKSVTLEQPFMADDGWLRDIKVRARNISGRPIVHV